MGDAVLLASLYQRQGQYEQAEPLFKRAVVIMEHALGTEHPSVAICLNNLAIFYQVQGLYGQAEPLCKRALAIQEKALGAEHPEVALSLNNLAVLYQAQGLYGQAESLYTRALAIQEKALSTEHPHVAAILNNLANLDFARGQLSQALSPLQRSLQITESWLRQTVSEPRVEALLTKHRYEEDMAYSLLLAPRSEPAARRLALTLSLLRKGRSAEAGARANRAVADSLATREQRDCLVRWQQLREQREQFLFAGPDKQGPARYQQRLAELKLKIDSLEQELADASPLLRTFTFPKWEDLLPAVARKLPAHSALVEVVLMTPYPFLVTGNDARWGKPRYVAMILSPEQRIEVADLGEAEAVDRLVAELLVRLQNPASAPRPAALALYQAVFSPLDAKVSGLSRLYLSLDGTLSLVPFAALHDGRQYLVDRYQLHYLTSGRDLLRERVGPSPQPPWVFADPDLGAAAPSPGETSEGALDWNTRSLYSQLHQLPRLPGTRREAEMIASLLPATQVRTAQSATEQALRRVRAPHLLHIATHGVFLQDEPPAAPPEQSAGRGLLPRAFVPLETPSAGAAAFPVLRPAEDNPLSRSALVLAGAAEGARSPAADQDGLLTADEVRSLNLWGTELVVLSACESGRGEVRTGQGVYGLRRAFFIAGAETLVTSLWRIADQETGVLMQSYYQRLVQQGQPRVGAMQEAMKEMRKKKPHPYYWSPFVVLGRDAPLSRQAAPGKAPGW